ncbi:UNVERIFIED_CONTAM: hypothetical protein Slati_2107000 [Sesamum latifolium]|uniref:Retrotransposon gag domain-containing protein n=1 Tax=Sesamum latifolium TaxID=2727402 RepID=A0AAW2WQQ6_9LAMI
MPPKPTQAMEEAILSILERLAELHASLDQHIQLSNQRHESRGKKYFSYHQVPPPQRFAVILFYIQGETLSWFKWLYTNQQLSSWDAFLRALELRFGPSSFDNHQAALFKLRQRGYRRKARQFLLLTAEDPDPPDPPDPPLETPVEPPLLPLSPLGSAPDSFPIVCIFSRPLPLFRHQVARTLCLLRRIREHDVTILIDSGSSHNIVQPRVADYLGLPVSPVSSFPHSCGQWGHVALLGVCSNVPLQLQSHPFSVSLYVLRFLESILSWASSGWPHLDRSSLITPFRPCNFIIRDDSSASLVSILHPHSLHLLPNCVVWSPPTP